jgi:hypothetical protein
VRVFHTRAAATNTAHTSATTPALSRLGQSLQDLRERGLAGEDFERFEREVHGVFQAAEREVLAEELARLDVDLPFVEIGGVRHHRVLRSTETYLSAVGPLRVERTLYRAGHAPAVVALDRRAGIVEGHWTPLAARQAAFLVAHLTPQEAEGVLAELGNMRPSKSSLDRLPKRLSARWEAERTGFEARLRETLVVPEEAVTMAASLDGVLVPMKDGERAAKREAGRAEGKESRGPAGYQEVGCGTLSFYDAAGERLKTVRLARMPQAKKATLKSTLAAEVQAALAQRPSLTVVKVADGAKDNWTFLETLVAQGEPVVDFFHAAGHLQDAFEAAYGEGSPAAQAQGHKYRHLLREDEDGAEKVIRALAYLRGKHPRRRRIAQVLGYFRRHRHRMAYAALRGRHLPIGSGVIEAACKTLASQRLKRSGMRWRHPGGQAILTLRALVQSERFEHGWAMLSATYKSEVVAPENVTPFPRQRAA